MDHGLLLYDYAGSPCARRVRISLMEKGLAWDTQPIDLSRMEQKQPEYLAINPNGLVPTLAHGERVVWESNVITQYLDDAFPEKPLYPEDPWELAQVRQWQAADAAMARDYRPLMYQRLIGPVIRAKRGYEETMAIARSHTQNPADLDWESRVWQLAVLTPDEERQVEHRLWTWLEKVEQALARTGWLVGERFSQAEISVYPRVMMYPYIGLKIDAKRYPNTVAWLDKLGKRSSFAATLTKQDEGLLKLARSGVLGWLGRTVALPRPGPLQRIGLKVMRRVLLKAERASQSPGRAAGLRKPRRGDVAPISRTRAARPVDPRQLREPHTLYQFPSAPEAVALRRLMDELRIPYSAEPLAFGEAPVLRHGNRQVHDTLAIAEYLAAVHGDERWFPRDSWQLARARMWLAFDAAMHKEFKPLFAVAVVRVVPTPRFDHSPENSRQLLRGRLDVIEAELAGGDYLLGSQPCFADIALTARFESFPSIGIEIDTRRWPRVAAWMRRVHNAHVTADATIPANAIA